MPNALPIAAVVATRDRPGPLSRTLASLAEQEALPAELVLVDASRESRSREAAGAFAEGFARRGCTLSWEEARVAGAGAQRNQGLARVSQDAVWFFDDDVYFAPACLKRLAAALQSDRRLGGVSAMIVNQSYGSPGRVSRLLFAVMAGRRLLSYAGCVVGPAVNFLPEDRDDLPEVVAVEWLNTTCTLYRREALPNPSFAPNFDSYSFMEDLALSLVVGKSWKLANARRARIFHDSQPGAHKDNVAARSKKELMDRHHIMTRLLGRRGFGDYLRLFLWESFQLAVCAVEKRGGPEFWQALEGKAAGLRDLCGAAKRGR